MDHESWESRSRFKLFGLGFWSSLTFLVRVEHFKQILNDVSSRQRTLKFEIDWENRTLNWGREERYSSKDQKILTYRLYQSKRKKIGFWITDCIPRLWSVIGCQSKDDAEWNNSFWLAVLGWRSLCVIVLLWSDIRFPEIFLLKKIFQNSETRRMDAILFIEILRLTTQKLKRRIFIGAKNVTIGLGCRRNGREMKFITWLIMWPLVDHLYVKISKYCPSRYFIVSSGDPIIGSLTICPYLRDVPFEGHVIRGHIVRSSSRVPVPRHW